MKKILFEFRKLLMLLVPPLYKGSCGHGTRRKGVISAFGERSILRMPKKTRWTVDYCLDCVAKMTIRCAWCPNLIFVGDPVTLYSPIAGNQIPEGATIYNEENRSVVGCLGWECANTGADRAGFWVPGENGKGKVKRVISPFEQVFFGNHDTLIVEDLGDTREAVSSKTQ